MAVMCGMPTIQYSARSARLMVAYSVHLNLEIKTAFWDRNGVLKHKRQCVEADRKIPEFNGVPKVKL